MSTPRLRPSPVLLALALGVLTGCGAQGPGALRDELGDFRLGYTYVAAETPTKGPFSRDATEAELTGALAQAIEARLARYDGGGLYHFGISIGGYVLAQPGLPVIYTPKSVMIFDVTVYDNATGTRLTDEPHRFTAFEGLQNTAPIVGSGIARDADAQLANLAAEGARQLEAWLAEHPEWFVPDPDTPRTPFDRAAERQRLAAARDRVRAARPAPAPAADPAPVATLSSPVAGGVVRPGT